MPTQQEITGIRRGLVAPMIDEDCERVKRGCGKKIILQTQPVTPQLPGVATAHPVHVPHRVSPVGFDMLKTEEKALWVRRKDVTIALTAAAAEGDRSENAEYQR